MQMLESARDLVAVFLTSVLFAFSVLAPKLAAKSRDDVSLFQVKTIFLQGNHNTWAVDRLLPSALKDALVSYGFKVVANSADADGVMEANTSEWITLDGPQPDPAKHGFHFLLASSKYNVTWETTFDIATRANDSELVRKAAQKNLLESCFGCGRNLRKMRESRSMIDCPEVLRL
jgi:hypothetical protein